MRSNVLIGQRFGRLTVVGVGERSKDGRPRWICQCDCGKVKEKPVLTSSLHSGKTTSCGCKYSESNKITNRRHGMTKKRIHVIWCSMRQRCKKNKNYKGITICKEWDIFENFMDWAYRNGYDDTLTIDRIDNKCGYCPENCRWVSYKVQENNRRNNVHVTIHGETHTIAEWGQISCIGPATIRYRMKHNWDNEDLLLKPNERKE